MKHLSLFIFALCFVTVKIYGQNTMNLENIFAAIQTNHPTLKMYDAQIRSLDEASKGAKSWAPPEFGAGFFMTPYNVSLTKAR
nr:TolC family protein [Bacteroidota bacterium]